MNLPKEDMIRVSKYGGGLAMRKELLFAFTAFFFLSLTAITGAYAVEKDTNVEKVIFNEETDITNDTKEEKIYLKGETTENTENNHFYRELVIEVIHNNSEKASLSVEGGYSPKLHLIDINDDGKKELFLTILGNERGTQKNFYFIQFQNNKLVELSKPELNSIESQFRDGYKAQLTIEESKTYIFDLYDRKEHYEELGLYHKGRLNEPTELIVGPYTELKVSRHENKTAIKGRQPISGIASVDTIGYLETMWTWKNSEWGLERVKVKEISHRGN